MTLSVTHAKVATLPDEAGAEINKAEWNDLHTVSGTIDGTNITAIDNTPIGGGAPSTGAFTTLSASGLFALTGVEDLLTAFSTGGQASATALSATKNFHRVTTVAAIADSVKLPAATAGQIHYVRNDGANAMQVFGQSTETINGVVSATGVAHGPGMGVFYVCTTAGAWTATPISQLALSSNLRGTASFAPVLDMGNTRSGMVTFSRIDSATSKAQVGYDGTNGLIAFDSSGAVTFGSAAGTMTADTSIVRASANSLRFGGTTNATTTARTELNKAVASISNAVATTVLTITIPNAAHSASLLVRVTGSLGAGGAIGANEATASNAYIVTVTRTSGVNAVAAISSAFGGAAAAVAGAATVTCTAALAAVSGAVGASNTIDVQATISRSAGSSTNHTCLVYAQLMNANAAGITIA